jgi:hypothetical protein
MKKTLYKHIMCVWSKYIFKIILWKLCSIKLIITNRWNCTTNKKIKGIRNCIIIEKKLSSLIDKTKNKLE